MNPSEIDDVGTIEAARAAARVYVGGGCDRSPYEAARLAYLDTLADSPARYCNEDFLLFRFAFAEELIRLAR